MSYIDRLDRKRSIQAARHEMNHFSDLYKMHETYDDSYRIRGASCNCELINMINYLNYDSREINKIERRDRQIEEIQKVLKAISKIRKEKELEYIFYKYIQVKTNEEIEEVMKIKRRTRERISSDALFTMALLLNVEVFFENM
ncbi:hypothetical protein [Thomasclavelia cocleata]|uniref:hypothetical protein n=1 Tax=Thomasclavelia cocleata TaxID=69824 RepID=UPI00242ED5F8|nr:hypothetical protein [Thomasclavelia cocleata]